MVHPPIRPSFICTIAAQVILAATACYSPPDAKSDISYTAPATQVTNGNVTGGGNTSVKAVQMQVLPARDANYSAGPNSKYIAVADFEGTGHLSVAVSNNTLNNIRIYKHPGLDANLTPETIIMQDGPRHVVAADLNQDTFIDLAVATNGNVAVLLNNGGGNFTVPVYTPLGAVGGFRVAAADLDNDTHPDLVVAGMNNTLAVLHNTSAGSFPSATSLNFMGMGRSDVAVADVNGDATPDIVAVAITPPTMGVYINQGNLAFAQPVAYTVNTGGHTITLADVDADRDIDAIVNDQAQTVTVLYNDGTGNFSSQDAYTINSGAWPDDVAIGDMNGDGRPDMAISTWEGSDMTLMPNIGGGKFGNIQHIGTPGRNWQVLIADMDGDGKNDLVSCAETYSLQLMVNTTM